MTSGEFLYQKYKFKSQNVVYTKIYGLAYNIYIIYYRSKNINIPITNYDVRQKNDQILSVKRFPKGNEMFTFPIRYLKDMTDNISDAIIFCIDLDGRYGDANNRVKRENVNKTHIKEWVTFKTLQSADSISTFTKKYRDERNKLIGYENFTAKLISCQYDPNEDAVTFMFSTKTTHNTGREKEVDPDDGFKIKENPSGEYMVLFKILDFMKWLKDTRPDSISDKKISWREIKDVLQITYVQIWDSCPAFYWQGIDYWLSQLDGAIYPTDIEPKRWNAPHLHGDGNAFLCKHSYGILKYIDFWANPMTNMLNKELKIRGVI